MMGFSCFHSKTSLSLRHGRKIGRPFIRLSLSSLAFCALSLWLPTVFFATSRLKSKHDADLLGATRNLSWRFPKYGTTEFASQCAWSLPRNTLDNNCTLFVSQRADASEGMADWISLVALGFFMAKQVGCGLLLDYGPGIDISQVLTPMHPEDSMYNWTVPATFECTLAGRCERVAHGYRSGKMIQQKLVSQILASEKELFGVPQYRSGYVTPIDNIGNMKRLWGDFQKDTGLACAMENLLQLSPKASELEPELFSDILPTLQDPESLVITIYIRTGLADETDPSKRAARLVNMKSNTIDRHLGCALQLEQQFLSGNYSGMPSSFSRVVWMLVTDSPELKEQVIQSYDKQDPNSQLPPERRKWKDRVVLRQVLVTQARGKHTKTKWAPSTLDFAEAFLDWYLIGESDLVVLFRGYSFGATGALRTARRVYEQADCTEIFLKE